MVFKQIFGWLLLFAGAAVIVYSLYGSFNIFTGASPVPELFTVEGTKETVLANQKESAGNTFEIEKMIGEQLGEQLQLLFPSSFLAKILNLTTWSIFAGILILGGSRLAGLGIKLLKP